MDRAEKVNPKDVLDVAKTVTVVDIAWMAGFLEGEGSFHFNQHSLRVAACQVEPAPLKKLKELVGGSICLVKKHITGRSPIYQWMLASKRAVGLVMSIYVFMSPKRKGQIEKVLQLWKQSPGSGSNNKFKTHCKHGHPFSLQNTYVRDGYRRCRQCSKDYKKKYRRIEIMDDWGTEVG